MAESDARDIRGVDVAGPEDGPPLVFVHGAIFTRKMWVPQRERLAEEYRVLAPDLPGHGERADRDFSMADGLGVVDDVVEAATPGSVLLVGLSLGGYVSTAYADRYPDKVDGLVLSGSSANPVGRLETATRAVGKVSRLAMRSERVENAARNRAEKWVRERDLPADQKGEMVRSGFYPRQYGIAGKYVAGRDFRGMLRSYPGPVLILNGEKDALMRRGEQDHAAAANDGGVEVVDGAGHVCNLHAPAEYTDAVRRFHRRSVGQTRPP